MTKEAYPALAAAHYDELRAIGQEPDFYTLEEKFDQLWTALGRSVLELMLGLVPTNKQKKQRPDPVRARSHRQNEPVQRPGAGLAHQPLSAGQVGAAGRRARVRPGAAAGRIVAGHPREHDPGLRHTQAAAQALPAAALDAPCLRVSTGAGPVHGMVDGSMLFTDTGWQEVKVGCVFQHRTPVSAPVGKTGSSHYVF